MKNSLNTYLKWVLRIWNKFLSPYMINVNVTSEAMKSVGVKNTETKNQTTLQPQMLLSWNKDMSF